MKRTGKDSWARRYQAALRKHLKQGESSRLEQAAALGIQAAGLGMEMLEVARIHEQALTPVSRYRDRETTLKRAEAFFIETIAPIEQTHTAARKASARLSKLGKVLGRRTSDLARSNRFLQMGIHKRKRAESALRKSSAHHSALWRESRALQEKLRKLTRRILVTHEARRKKISHQLHDEIAQTLLGINVRLLVLKKEARANVSGLNKEVASTQQLVGKLQKAMKRFGKGWEEPHET